MLFTKDKSFTLQQLKWNWNFCWIWPWDKVILSVKLENLHRCGWFHACFTISNTPLKLSRKSVFTNLSFEWISMWPDHGTFNVKISLVSWALVTDWQPTKCLILTSGWSSVRGRWWWLGFRRSQIFCKCTMKICNSVLATTCGLWLTTPIDLVKLHCVAYFWKDNCVILT